MLKNSLRLKRNFAQETCFKGSGRLIQQLKMLAPKSRIGVAVSGGVDSGVLLYCLYLRQQILPFPFEIIALHLNPGFEPENHRPLANWLRDLGIPAHLEVTDYGPHAHSEENLRRSACFRCAWLRRKRLFELCDYYQLSHLALGHNLDDLVHTFFLNLCRNGRVAGLTAKEDFFKGKLQVIRPLLGVEKKYIIKAAKAWQIPVWQNPCPSANNSARKDMAETIKPLFNIAHDSQTCIQNALLRWQVAEDQKK